MLQNHLVRPTTNAARQAIFSILENNAVDWHRVLDLYAGCGTLGIEALSRRAEWADFADQSKKCCDIIKRNLEKVGLSDKAHIYCCAANKAISFLNKKYDIIFIDPPYLNPTTNDLIANLAASKLLGENSVVVVCHGNRLPLNSSYNGLHLTKEHRYGDTLISIYQRELKS